jgi:threonine dehydrogenase-like Zn-dependent dehydrogenase
LPADRATIARLMCVSMSTLTTTTARPGDRVLVTGAGPVGFLAAQIFALCGYDVHVVEPDDQRRQNAARGAVVAVYPRVPTDDAALTQTFALALECSGHEQAALDACQMLQRRGELVQIATPWCRRTELYAHELLRRVFFNYVVLRSGWEWELPRHPEAFRTRSIQANLETALEWLAHDRIPLEGLIQTVDPADAQAVYQDHLHHRDNRFLSLFDWHRAR